MPPALLFTNLNGSILKWNISDVFLGIVLWFTSQCFYNLDILQSCWKNKNLRVFCIRYLQSCWGKHERVSCLQSQVNYNTDSHNCYWLGSLNTAESSQFWRRWLCHNGRRNCYISPTFPKAVNYNFLDSLFFMIDFPDAQRPLNQS